MSAYPKNVFTRVDALVPRGDMGAPTEYLPVAANQTIREGDLLVLASGRLTQAVARPSTNNTFTVSGGSLGTMYFAKANIVTGGSPALTEQIPVVNLANARVLIRIYNATPADSQWQDLAVGTAYRVGHWRGTSDQDTWYALSTNSTNGDVTYQAPSPESDPTDNFGIVEVSK